MKKLVLQQNAEKKKTPTLMEVIHMSAKANGSEYRIKLEWQDDAISSVCGYANPEYTKGYYAVLFLIDSLDDSQIAYTNPSNSDWFKIKVMDSEKLKKYLMDEN